MLQADHADVAGPRPGQLALRLARRLYVRPGARVEIAGRAFELQWTPDVPLPLSFALHLHAGPLRFVLHMDAQCWPVELAPELLATQAPALRQALLNCMLAPVLAHVGALLRREACIAWFEFQVLHALPGDYLGLRLSEPGADARAGCAMHGLLYTRQALAWTQLLRALERADALACPAAHTPNAPLREPLTLLLGRSPISAAALGTLHAGDVLLVASRPAARCGFHLLRANGDCVGECLVGMQETDASFRTPEDTMQLEIHPSRSDTIYPGGDVALTLHIEIGTASVTLQELQQLRPGDTITLDQPLQAQELRVRCGPSCVGVGDLLELDGRLAVRLRRVG